MTFTNFKSKKMVVTYVLWQWQDSKSTTFRKWSFTVGYSPFDHQSKLTFINPIPKPTMTGQWHMKDKSTF